jgi:hypothetical protein
MHPLRYSQVRFKDDRGNGGKATCNVYFRRFLVDGLA